MIRLMSVKVPKRRVCREIYKVERGKPREQETQIKVGELFEGNLTGEEINLFIDKYLPPSNRNRTWLIENLIFLYKEVKV